MALNSETCILLTLVSSIIINTFWCECGNVKAIDACDTANDVAAFLIYMVHGVREIEDLCKSIDGKTSRIYGYHICVIVAEKHFPASQIYHASCQQVEINQSKSNHLSQPNKKIDAVQCKYKDKNRPAGYNSFYVTRVVDDKYLVAVEKNSPKVEISACMTIVVKNPVIPVLKLEPTDNSQDADDMFALYGIQETDKEKGVKHICDTISGSPGSGKNFCRKALSKLGGGNFIEETNVTCEHVKIHHRENGKVNGRPKISEPIRAVTCWYYLGRIKYVVISNATKKGLYYVATSWNKDNPLMIDRCISIS